MNKPTSWFELLIPSPVESFESIENFLFENGCSGCEEEIDLIKAYFPENTPIEHIQKLLSTYLKNLSDLGWPTGRPAYRIIPAQDWNQKWKTYFKPVRVTQRIVVKPPWSEWTPSSNEIIINIMPKMAFGTGSHETTQLCLELLECYLKFGDKILDAGAGSGILSIAAAKLGAKKIVAVDIDENALENARENIALNRVKNRVELYSNFVEIIPLHIFNMILANINRTTLISLLPVLKTYSDHHTTFILSGILCQEKSYMEKTLIIKGFRILEAKIKGEWCAFVLHSKSVE